MRWEGERQSDNVEDRRGQGGGFGGVAMRRGGIGIGAILLALVGGWLLGINPLEILGLIGGIDGGQVVQAPAPSVSTKPGVPPADPGGRFVSTVLASTEDTWTEVFRQGGAEYRPPRLVMFNGATRTACGLGKSAAGPFYCPEDRTVYIDLDFYRMLQQRFKAPGDFAQAYVVAHEVGHHVQNLLGTITRCSPGESACRSGSITSCRFGSNCRPIATPASGLADPSRPRAGSRRGMSRKA